MSPDPDLHTGQPVPRSFRDLHRDLWTVVRAAPGVFLLLPAILWFPFDIAVEWLTRTTSATWVQAMRAESWASLLVGNVVVGAALAACRRLSEGRPTPVLACLGEGLRLWWRIVTTSFLANLLTGILFLLLVVPGVWMLVNVMVVLPVLVFEGVAHAAAIQRSRELVRGRWWATALRLVALTVLVGLVGISALLLAPAGGSPVWVALASIPLNLGIVLFAVFTVLLYADAAGRADLRHPIGPPTRSTFGEVVPRPAGAGGVVGSFATATALGLAAILTYGILAGTPIETGDEAWLRGDYEECLRQFERAEFWDPDDDYVIYSIALAHQKLGHTDEAVRYARRAISMVPTDPDYKVLLVDVLIDNGQREEAERELRALHGSVDQEILDFLWERMAESRGI